MGAAAVKQPQDRKPKKATTPAQRLRDEVSKVEEIAEVGGRKVTIETDDGPVVVTLRDMLDWRGSVMTLLKEGDYLEAFCGMISRDDAARLRAADPTIGALMTAYYAEGDSGEVSLGESHAS